MRKTGEGSFTKLAQARKATISIMVRTHLAKCRYCGCVVKLSLAVINRIKGVEKFRCYDCSKNNREEVNRALLNLAKRKQEIKNLKR